MGKKKASLSLFSRIVQQIQPASSSSSSNDYHFIENECFPSFNSVDEIEQFQEKLLDKQQARANEEDDEDDHHHHLDLDMKTFAQQYLLDLPENLQLSPISSQDVCQTELPKIKENPKRKSTAPVKLTTEMNTKRPRRHVRDLPQSSEFIYPTDHRRSNIADSTPNPSLAASTSPDSIAEPLMIKNEPIESEQLPPTKPMGFGTSEFPGVLDNYVQNIHLLQPPTSESPPASSRPQRIRKRKRFFNEESESIARQKRLKPSFRKKRSLPSAFTDAEIEQQFGERLPCVKSEHEELAQSRVMVEYERIQPPRAPQTPMERARAKLTTALERGHEPDAYLLKIRSREQKMVEVELAIYSTADWYSERTRILTKIEEALRGLRVSWTKIDIRVDDFDIQISTSSQNATSTPPSSISNANSSWFLKILSDAGPLIVHIHDRRRPHQRLSIKCPCPDCSPKSFDSSPDSSLPVIVNVLPPTTPTRRLTPPSILNKTSSQTNISSLHNIHTTFFSGLISEHGRNIVIPVTQCVLDLALIVSVYSALPSLCVASKEEYKKRYQHIIDPLKCTWNETTDRSMTTTKASEILSFYQLIKSKHVNIRNPKAMRTLITSSSQFNPPTKQQVQCTPIIEFKAMSHADLPASVPTSARVIRLSIAQSALSSPTIRLVASSSHDADATKSKTDSVIPLVPKQINIIKPFLSTSGSLTPAMKLSNPVLISNKSQPPATK